MWGEQKDKLKKESGLGQEFYTFLGKGVDFKGKAQFEGTVRVDGNFEGEISIDDTLIIGESAFIKGTITGGTIVSSGRIEGTVTANKKIELLKPAIMKGDVHTPTFSVEAGVYFQGMCDMGAAPHATMDFNDQEMKNGKSSLQKLESDLLDKGSKTGIETGSLKI
jgi:cytoskeletal protein CcmA (bactofilin family)